MKFLIGVAVAVGPVAGEEAVKVAPTPALQRPEIFILDGNGIGIPGNIVLEYIFDGVKYKMDKIV